VRVANSRLPGEFGGAANTMRATLARRLTDNYVQLRFSKDATGMQQLFAEDIELPCQRLECWLA